MSIPQLPRQTERPRAPVPRLPPAAGERALRQAMDRPDTFAAALEKIAPADRLYLLHRSSASAYLCRGLLRRALQQDHVGALLALRQALREPTTRAPGSLPAPQRCLLATVEDEALADAATLRLRPRLALHLLQQKKLAAARFVELFGDSPHLLGRALATAALNLPQLLALHPVAPSQVVRWLQRRQIGALTFLRFARTAVGQQGRQLAEAQVQAGFLPAAAYVRVFLPSAAQASAWALQGTLRAAQWPAEMPMPMPVAEAWLRQGSLSQARFDANAFVVWTPEQPLPAPQIDWARAQQRLASSTLLDRMCLPPAARAPAVRLAYTARLLAAHAQGPLPDGAPARLRPGFLRSLWQRLPWGGPAAAKPGDVGVAAPAATCAVCFAPLDPGANVACLERCQHAAACCATCLAETLRTDAAGRCPVVGCRQVAGPEEALRLGLTPTEVDRLAKALLKTARARQAHWIGCPTPGCCGGALLAHGHFLTANCRACGHTVQLSHREAVTDANRAQLGLLVDGLRNMHADALPGSVREAWCCGRPVEHDDGCTGMFCAACQKSWNFVLGNDPLQIFAMEMGNLEQRYVPRGGLLLRCGLYDGLEPGSVQPQGVYAHVRAVAQARQILG